MTNNVCRASSPVAIDATALLVLAALEPRRVWIVEPDCICFVTLNSTARTAYIRWKDGVVHIDATVDGWPV